MPIVNSEHFLNQVFDYIVVGGGTAGLVVAARLSEIPSIRVGVLEAGRSYLGDVEVDTTAPFARTVFRAKAADFSFVSCPQTECHDRQITAPRGKALGGSSAINFVKMDRASAGEYDAIEGLGNPGWGWDSFLKYFKKSETLQNPPLIAQKLGAAPDSAAHGTDGPIQITYQGWHVNLLKPFYEALDNLGLPLNPDPAAGCNIGYSPAPAFVNQDKKRSYSANAYFEPVAQNPNLFVLCEASVTKMELEKLSETGPGAKGQTRVTGIHFQHNGSGYFVRAEREVILSCGGLCSPQILELSGIGNRSVLEKFGIPVIVDLPEVGENLQDHPLLPVDFEVRKDMDHQNLEGIPDASEADEQERLLAEGRGSYYGVFNGGYAFCALKDFASEEERKQISASLLREEMRYSHPGWSAQFELLNKWLEDENVAPIELVQLPCLFPSKRVPQPGSRYTSFLVLFMHPASRGSVHIQSTDITTPPLINPAYLETAVDLQMAKLALRHLLKIANTEGWKNVTESCLSYDEIKSEKDDPLGEYCREWLNLGFHWMGTAAMLPREKGGVVDERLRVYGVQNLRIVDTSIIPIALACHLTATVYALAEKAADMIKEEWKASSMNLMK